MQISCSVLVRYPCFGNRRPGVLYSLVVCEWLHPAVRPRTGLDGIRRAFVTPAE